MAINPESQYPGKIAPATSQYPYGAARNITLPGDGTGTPWEAALVNDIFGFQQSLLAAAGVVPTGTPDSVGASQYLQSLFKSSGLVKDDYAALRAVESDQLSDNTTCLISDTITGGFFELDKSDTTSLDNGGTILVDANEGRWKRVLNGVINSNWFDPSEAVVYVSTTGSDTNNHGFDIGSPFATLQKAADVFLGLYVLGNWKIKIAAGTYADGMVLNGTRASNEIVVEGGLTAGAPNVIIDGTTAATVMGLNFNATSPVRVKYVKVQNFAGVGSGIIFQNGTRGVIDTCDAHSNAEANFNCSEDSEIVMVGTCNATGASKFGIRVYRNSGGSIGDGTNTITIDGATQDGIVSRDGSKVVTNDNLIVKNCNSTATTSAVRAQKDGYVELRTCTISNNSLAVVAENNSIVDNQTGVVSLVGNTQNYRITDNSNDRSQYSASADVMQHWKPRSNPTGIGVSSNYDLVLDYNGATGFQFLSNGNNINIDFDKSSRLTHVASDSSFRVTANGAEYRFLSTGLIPSSDNLRNLGAASARWATVYAGTGTINTSDEREKTELLALDDKERAAALELKGAIRKFKFKDAIDKKGEDNARIHFGVGAQTVKAIFDKHGLNANDYALLCYDEWGETVEAIEAVTKIDPDTGEEVEIVPERTIVHPAGNRYGIRYDELLAFIISVM